MSSKTLRTCSRLHTALRWVAAIVRWVAATRLQSSWAGPRHKTDVSQESCLCNSQKMEKDSNYVSPIPINKLNSVDIYQNLKC